MAFDQKYGEIEIPGIPADEPIFILRAKDRAAARTIEDYGINAELVGATQEFLKSLNGVADAFNDFGTDNPELMKVPD